MIKYIYSVAELTFYFYGPLQKHICSRLSSDILNVYQIDPTLNI